MVKVMINNLTAEQQKVYNKYLDATKAAGGSANVGNTQLFWGADGSHSRCSFICLRGRDHSPFAGMAGRVHEYGLCRGDRKSVV